MNRRLELQSYGEPLVIVEQELSPVPPNGAIVKVSHAGVCHSDLHIWKVGRKHPLQKLPLVLGHEIAGTIIDFGSDANPRNMKIGDKVIIFPYGNCGKCNYCVNDNQLCPVTQLAFDTDPNDTWAFGVFADGGYQTHLSVPDMSLIFPVPADTRMDLACMLPCGALTGYNAIISVQSAVDEAIRVNGKATLVVVGAGGVCLWAIQICKAIFPENVRICAVDVEEEKLQDAKDAGADIAVCWEKDPKAIQESAQSLVVACGGKLDAAIDFTGFKQTILRLLFAAQNGATVSIVGLGGGQLPPIPLPVIAMKGIRIQGVFTGNKDQLKKVLQMFLDGKVKPPPISHITLEEVNATFQNLLKGKQRGRAIIQMSRL